MNVKRLIPYNVSPSTHVLFCLHVTCFNSIKWSIWIFVLCTLLCHREWKSPTSYMSPARAESLAIKRTYPVCLHHCCFWIPSAGYPSCNPWIEPFWSRWKEKNCIWKQKHNTTKIIKWHKCNETQDYVMCATHLYLSKGNIHAPWTGPWTFIPSTMWWSRWKDMSFGLYESVTFLINMFFCAIRCIVLTMQYNYVLYKFWPVGASFNNKLIE